MPALPPLRFAHLAFLVSLPITWLLFMQTTSPNDAYPADVGMHVMFVQEADAFKAENYSLMHKLTGQLARIGDLHAGVEFGNAIKASFVIVLGAAFYFSLIQVQHYLVTAPTGQAGWRTGAVSVAVFWVSMLLFGSYYQTGYIGQWTPNSWTNPTYTFSRVFAIALFVQFIRFNERSELKVRLADWILIAVIAPLAMWAKPSFLLSFALTVPFVLLFRWARKQIALAEAAKWCAAYLPAGLVLIAITLSVYAVKTEGAEPSQVVFSPGTGWGIYSVNIPLSLLLGVAFPLYVVILRCRALSTALAIGTVHFVTSTAVFYFLAETGPRATHANFAWTYMFGMFFFFLTAAQEWFLRRPHPRKAWWWIGTALFAWHLISGLVYFGRILTGNSYF